MSAAVRGLQAGFQMGGEIMDGVSRMVALRDFAEKRRREQAMREAWTPVAQRMGEVLKRASTPPTPTDAATTVPVVSGLGVAVRPNEPQLTAQAPTSSQTSVPPTPGDQAKSTWTPGSPMQTRADMEAAARYHAGRAKVDPELVLRVLQAESAFNPDAVSKAGATGLMQLMPATAAQPGYGVTPLRDQSPEENIRFGTDYLAAMMREYGGDTERALAAYNAGPGRVSKSEPIPNNLETQAYVAKIMGGYTPDPRMADTSGQPSPAVAPQSLPARPVTDTGLGPAPTDPVQTFMAQADPNELSQLYQEGLGVMLQHPELSKEIAPSLEAFGKLGIARWMQSYEGDPASLDYFKHMGKGMAMFGQTMDPMTLLTAQLSIKRDEREDSQEARAQGQEARAQSQEDRAARKDAADLESTKLETEEKRHKFEQQQSYDSLRAIHSALSNDGILTPSEIRLLEGMDIKDIQESVNSSGEKVYSAQIPGMKERVSGTAAELKSYIESLAASMGSEEAMKDTIRTISTTDGMGGTQSQLVRVGKTSTGEVVGSVIPVDGATPAAEQDDARWKRAEQQAKAKVKEMAGWMSRDKSDFAAFGGSRAEAERQLTQRYYDEMTGTRTALPAEQGLAPAQASQPTPGPQANASQAAGRQVYVPGQGVAIERDGKLEIVWPEGEKREKDGKVYIMKNGSVVPVDG